MIKAIYEIFPAPHLLAYCRIALSWTFVVTNDQAMCVVWICEQSEMLRASAQFKIYSFS